MADDTTPLLNTRYRSQQSFGSDRSNPEVDHVERHAPKKPGVTSSLAFAVAASIFGSSFQVGYNTGVVNSPAEVIKDFYNSTYFDRDGSYISTELLTFLWSITVSCYAVGGMLGGMTAGFWANRYGRRGALLRNNILVVVSVALMGFCKMGKSYEMLIVGRIISGINAGINSGIAPLYLSEISPVLLRGLCGTFNQLAICSGVLVGEVIGLNLLLGTEALWPLVVGFPIVPLVFQLLTLPSCPETPRYLMVMQGDEDEAEKALVWLRKTEDVGEELEEMRKESVEMRNAIKFSVSNLFSQSTLRWPLIICIVLQLAQQFSGINAVIYYSTQVFEGAGLSKPVAQYATAGTGAVNVLWTLVSAVLMDKLGRRTLMLVGLCGMFIFTVVLTISLVYQPSASWLSYLCIVSVVLYIVAFATGPGAIPWFYVAELFAQGPRSAAVSISVLINWLANFTVGLVFPHLQDAIHEFSFVPFAAVLLFSALFVFFFVPETKGKRIEDITLLFEAPDEMEDDSQSESLSYQRQHNDTSNTNIQDMAKV